MILPRLKTFDRIFDYQKILCQEIPDFLYEYSSLPLLSRLDGVGLLCGTDWTPLYQNRFFYSRLDHSFGCALIVWNFTHDKKQTLAALLHDVSTPVFSHVSDFMKGDALTQQATEADNSAMIMKDPLLAEFLARDGINAWEIQDYHVYPVCDNEIPSLSADRLEYMFPSGMGLGVAFDMETVKSCYESIRILKNEDGTEELGFADMETALVYFMNILKVGLAVRKNENKIALNLLGDIVFRALELGIISIEDCYNLSERRVLEIFIEAAESKKYENIPAADKNRSSAQFTFSQLISTFFNMKEIIRSENSEDLKGCYKVSFPVKTRWINPLVQISDAGLRKAKRLTEISVQAQESAENFLNWKDSGWAGVQVQ